MAKKKPKLIYTPSPLAAAKAAFQEAEERYEREYLLARRLEKERNERVSNFAIALDAAKKALQVAQREARSALPRTPRGAPAQGLAPKPAQARAKIIVPDSFEDL